MRKFHYYDCKLVINHVCNIIDSLHTYVGSLPYFTFNQFADYCIRSGQVVTKHPEYRYSNTYIKSLYPYYMWKVFDEFGDVVLTRIQLDKSLRFALCKLVKHTPKFIKTNFSTLFLKGT